MLNDEERTAQLADISRKLWLPLVVIFIGFGMLLTTLAPYAMGESSSINFTLLVLGVMIFLWGLVWTVITGGKAMKTQNQVTDSNTIAKSDGGARRAASSLVTIAAGVTAIYLAFWRGGISWGLGVSIIAAVALIFRANIEQLITGSRK